MIKIKLISRSNTHPLDMSSHAAKYCYASVPPKFGSRMDVENDLFKVSHHTTMEHTYFTFAIEGISIADVTFGLHLTHPFYNTDQRSGRFCSKMYLEPDIPAIKKYIKSYWPEVDKKNLSAVIGYIKKALGIYQSNIEQAREVCKKFIQEERPFANAEYLEKNGPKIAQEQMRVFIPLILPTGLDYTIDLITLVSMYEAAWNPVLKNITAKMAELVVAKYPETAFMFNQERRLNIDWSPKIENEKTEILYNPCLKLLGIDGEEKLVMSEDKMKHPVDLLHFHPSLMNNNVGDVKIEIECSLANMGDDQRHRMVKRGLPSFTGNFYFYPIVRELGLEKDAIALIDEWKKIAKTIPGTLATAIAPYGLMAKYEKKASFNALIHEMAKRLCWCAHREIYHLGKLLREEIIKIKGASSPILRLLEPKCCSTGACGEGKRYCGRNLNLKNSGDFFPERKV